MFQRPITLFLCLMITLSCLGGCSMHNSSPTNLEEKPWEGVITLWDFPRWPYNGQNRFGWIEKKIAEFEKTHPGVYIHLTKLKWEYGMIELRAAASSGVSPDIAPVGADYDFILKDYLEPVDDYLTEEKIERYDPRAIESVTYQNRLYGFPWFITTNALLLNKEIFDNRNVPIPPEGTWTYEEFVQALQKLTYDKNKDGKPDIYGFNFYLNPGSIQLWPFLTMEGAKIFDGNGKFDLNSPQGISALTKLVELETKYKVVPLGSFGSDNENEVWGDFAEKKTIAVYPAGPWAVKILNERQKSGEGFEFDIAFYPKGQIQANSFATVCAYGIFKQENPKKRAICAEFLEFITSEKEQDELKEYGVFPVLRQSQQNLAVDENMKKMIKILDSAVLFPRVKNWSKIDEILTSEIRLALMGKKSPQQALSDAAIQVEKLTNLTE